MSEKYRQILAINLKPELTSRAASWSEKPVIKLSNINLDLELNITQEVDAILVSIYDNLDSKILARFPNLSYIGVLGTSTKKIALDYCARHNIKVSAVHEYCDHETAEWVILQILKFYREREFPQSVYEKTLGIVGVGAVGNKLAQKALGLGMKLNFYAPSAYPELVSMGAQALLLKNLFENSSIISFHTPPHLAWLKREHLDKLPKDALLINTCMGKISPGCELEQFLSQRPDVTLIIDSIAALSYSELKTGIIASSVPAYETTDSKLRLINKFFANLAMK